MSTWTDNQEVWNPIDGRWATITIDDLKAAKAAALVEALQTKALGTGQADPTGEIVANVVARIRAEIKGCARNKLDYDGTKIPRSLKSLACRMILREMQSRLMRPLSDDEKEEQRNDLKYLERIAKGEVPVDEPDTPIAGELQASSGAIKIVTSRTRNFTREKMEGL